jgi:hypothetical protein
MMLILHCLTHKRGAITLHAEIIDGVQYPARRYFVQDGVLILDGYPEAVLRHDSGAILSNPSGGYRMPTPREQETSVAYHQAQATIQEEVRDT